jgi:Glycosyltransferase family 87
MYGGTALAGQIDQQCAYPAFAAFPLAPLALLPFKTAQFVAFAAFLILTPMSAVWWRGWRSNTFLSVLLVLSAYPVIVALQLRQPTLLFFSLISACAASVRSRPIIAGVLLALATAKPQLAIAACVPLLFWAIAKWRERRQFVWSFLVTEAALLAAATLLVPKWLPEWLAALSIYAHYNNKPLVIMFFGSTAGAGIFLVVAAAAVFVGWKWREDPMFSVSFSIAALFLIVPFQVYNTVILLAPIFWLESHVDEVRSFGGIHQVLLAAVWMDLAQGFATVAALGAVGLLAPVTAAKYWRIPLVFTYFLPFIVFATLLAYVISATWMKRYPSRELPLPSQS